MNKRKECEYIYQDVCTEEKNERLTSLYKKHVNDPEAVLEMNGLRFYKIIDRFQIELEVRKNVVMLNTKMAVREADIVIDENDNCFTVAGFGMMEFKDSGLPEWYLKSSFVVFEDDTDRMGEYLALYNREY